MRPIRYFTFAVLLSAAAAPADVLHLRDGSEIKGKLTFCDEEVCSIDKRRVPVADIQRITLGTGTVVPADARDAGVVLSDGMVRQGKFTGLTLGYVEIGGEEIDRANVAEIILVAIPKADVIIDTEGNEHVGALTGCNAASCTVAGQTIPLSAIRWIGLAQETSAPPAAADRNLVFITDQQPVEARLSSIDGTTVRTTRGSFPRGTVTWIRLAPYVESAPPQPPIVRPSNESPPPTVQPPDRPDRPLDQPPPIETPPTPLRRGRQPGVGSRVWIGQLQGYMWGPDGDGTKDLRIFVDVRLTETGIRPLTDRSGKKIGDIILLSSAGSVVRNTHRRRGSDENCDGEGTTTVNPEVAGTWENGIFRNTGSGSVQPALGFDIPRGKQLYMLLLLPNNPPIPFFPVTCTDVTGTRTLDWPYLVPMAGRIPISPVLFDPEIRYLQDGKMIGTYTAPGSDPTYANVSLSWSICLEGMVCPPLAPPRGADDSAAPLPPREAPAGHDWCAEVARLLQLLRAAQEEYSGHEASLSDAQARVSAALDTIWGWEGALRKYFTSWLSIAAVGAGDKLRKAIELSEFLMNTDASGSEEQMHEAIDALYSMEDLVLTLAEKQAARDAARAGDAVLNAGGTESAVRQTYARAIENSEKLQGVATKITDALDVIKGAKEHYDDAAALGDGILNYAEAESDRQRNQSGLEAASRRLEAIRLQLEQARQGCAAQSRSSHWRRLPGMEWASLRPGPLAQAPSTDARQAIVARLEQTKQHLEQIPGQYQSAVKWLLPFLAKETAGVSPRMLALLLSAARPHLEGARTNLEAVAVDQAAFEQELTRAIPNGDAPRNGPTT